jgi:hypothetical protein
MADLKDELVQHIEAYAASKTVDNTLLQGWAAQAVGTFLDGIIVERPAVAEINEDEVPVEDEPADG